MRIFGAILALFSVVAHAGTAALTWAPPTHNEDGTPLTDLAGYRVYYGCESSGAYPNTIALDDESLTHYVVDGLPDAGTCYFAVTAVNASGVESRFSNEAIKAFSGEPPSKAPGRADISVTWAEPQPEPLMARTFPGNALFYLASADVPQSGDALTVFAMFRVPSVTSAAPRQLFARDEDGSGLRTYQFRINESGQLQGIVFVAGLPYSVAGGSLSADTWYKAAMTYDGETVSVYLDSATAVATNTDPSGDLNHLSNGVSIGGRSAFSGGGISRLEFFTGAMAQAGEWNRALTSGELATLMASGCPGDIPSGLIWHAPLDEASALNTAEEVVAEKSFTALPANNSIGVTTL